MSRHVRPLLHSPPSERLPRQLGRPENGLGLLVLQRMQLREPQPGLDNHHRTPLQLPLGPGSHDRNILRRVRMQELGQDQPVDPVLLQAQMRQLGSQMLYRRGHGIQLHPHRALRQRHENQRRHPQNRRRWQTPDEPPQGNHFLQAIKRHGRNLRHQPGQGRLVFRVSGLFRRHEHGKVQSGQQDRQGLHPAGFHVAEERVFDGTGGQRRPTNPETEQREICHTRNFVPPVGHWHQANGHSRSDYRLSEGLQGRNLASLVVQHNPHWGQCEISGLQRSGLQRSKKSGA